MADPGLTLLLATTNQGKVRELRLLLPKLRLLTPREAGIELDVDETGSTFVENARLKAAAYHAATRLPTMGEDSGIEIDALNGEPGVYSARYHGLPDGPIKNAHILEQLKGVLADKRGCRYVCAIVLLDADGEEHVFEGRCDGEVATEAAGDGGFGYDPIFRVSGSQLTMAQLDAEEKNRISHRGKAVRQLAAYLDAS